MKKLINLAKICTIMVVALFAASCSDDDNGGGSSSEFSASASGIGLVSKTGGTGTIGVRPATADVKVSSSADWCAVSLSSNEKLGKIYNVVVAPNTETSDREAIVTITSSSDSKTFTVKQVAKDGLLVKSDKTINKDCNEANIVVELNTNGDFNGDPAYNGEITVTPSASWLSVESTRANMTNRSVTMAMEDNGLTVNRTATVSFTLGDITESVTVNQSAITLTDNGMTHSAKELAKLMYPGWNLGNTMEGGSSDNNWTNKGGLTSEIAWQSTKTTKKIIDNIKSLGFKSVRIPTAWVMGHITDADNCTIDEAWMSRVEAVVNYCISNGLYVELNDHWDGGWLEQSFTDISDATVQANSDKLKKIWTQIANHFKNYDEHLMFGGLNEPGMNVVSNFSSSSVDALLKYEQAFIDAVRATGGNNATRVLVVQGPNTNIDQTSTLFDVTKLNDSATGRLMVEVHYYDPWQFCGLENDADWGKMWYYWGAGNDGDADRTANSGTTETYLNNQMKKMKTKYVDAGYAVIIGEYGANCRFTNDAKHDASIKAYYKAVNQYAISNGCVPFAWDTNTTSYPNMTILNRTSLKVFNQNMIDGVTQGVSAAVWPY